MKCNNKTNCNIKIFILFYLFLAQETVIFQAKYQDIFLPKQIPQQATRSAAENNGQVCETGGISGWKWDTEYMFSGHHSSHIWDSNWANTLYVNSGQVPVSSKRSVSDLCCLTLCLKWTTLSVELERIMFKL